MRPTLISRNASNWVDRGDAPAQVMQRILAHFFERPTELDSEWAVAHAAAIRGMVAADATEVDIARYLKDIAPSLGLESAPARLRLAGIALWHTAKVAQVRDLAEQMLGGDIPPVEEPQQELSRWLAERLLSPEELATYERERQRRDTPT